MRHPCLSLLFSPKPPIYGCSFTLHLLHPISHLHGHTMSWISSLIQEYTVFTIVSVFHYTHIDSIQSLEKCKKQQCSICPFLLSFPRYLLLTASGDRMLYETNHSAEPNDDCSQIFISYCSYVLLVLRSD